MAVKMNLIMILGWVILKRGIKVRLGIIKVYFIMKTKSDKKLKNMNKR